MSAFLKEAKTVGHLLGATIWVWRAASHVRPDHLPCSSAPWKPNSMVEGRHRRRARPSPHGGRAAIVGRLIDRHGVRWWRESPRPSCGVVPLPVGHEKSPPRCQFLYRLHRIQFSGRSDRPG